MYILDVNVLVNAVNSDSPQHEPTLGLLGELAANREIIGLPWVTVLGFLRTATNPAAMQRPLPLAEAREIVSDWFAMELVTSAEPGPRHWQIVSDLLSSAPRRLITDAHLAAIALERRSPMVTFDRDFTRFGVKVVVPGQPA